MAADPRLASLADYRARLEAVLTLFDAHAGPPAATLGHAWRACQDAFEVFRTQHVARAGEATPPEVQRAIDESLRLNAVAVAAVQRHKEDLVQKRREIARARAVLRSQETRPPSGRSCDLRG